MREHLMNSVQMAAFVDKGFHCMDGAVPAELCADLCRDVREGVYTPDWRRVPYQTPLDRHFHGTALQRVLALPAVAGMIASLVGPDPLYDHHTAHILPPQTFGRLGAGNVHQDFTLDLRPHTFDINISIFPEEVTPEMGGTVLVPGSQYRRPLNNNLYRYQCMKGMYHTVCKAGTVVAWHGNLWHAGGANRTDKERVMFKLRLNPTVPQVRLWNTDDLEKLDPVAAFMNGHAWMGCDHPFEYMHRARQWGFMTGAPCDLTGYWTRIGIATEGELADPRYRIPTQGGSQRSDTRVLSAGGTRTEHLQPLTR